MAVWIGILIPLAGTSLGAACVFFLRGEMNKRVRSALSGFAAGIMVAASVWSLLIPAIERSATLGYFSFAPAACGVLLGAVLLMMADRFIPVEYIGDRAGEWRTFFAITLHNLPEGMAVGAAFAGVLAGDMTLSMTAAMALATGVAIQNIPEGAIVSLPLRANGMPLRRAFFCGVGSGIIEPIGAALTLVAAGIVIPILPLLLGFAAGAMLYVAASELIPEVVECGERSTGNLLFILGFLVMMTLDVVLG